MRECGDGLIQQTLGSAIMVHTELGPGLLESVYEHALIIELKERGIAAEQQKAIPVTYRGKNIGIGFRADIIVEDKLVLELKSVDKFCDIHTAQLMTYLKLLNVKRGFLLNFNSVKLKQGIKKVSI